MKSENSISLFTLYMFMYKALIFFYHFAHIVAVTIQSGRNIINQENMWLGLYMYIHVLYATV